MKAILYTKNECGNCNIVKSIFDAMEVKYEVINIDENKEAKELIVSKNFLAAPILQIEDEFFGNLHTIKQKALELI